MSWTHTPTRSIRPSLARSCSPPCERATARTCSHSPDSRPTSSTTSSRPPTSWLGSSRRPLKRSPTPPDTEPWGELVSAEAPPSWTEEFVQRHPSGQVVDGADEPGEGALGDDLE